MKSQRRAQNKKIGSEGALSKRWGFKDTLNKRWDIEIGRKRTIRGMRAKRPTQRKRDRDGTRKRTIWEARARKRTMKENKDKAMKRTIWDVRAQRHSQKDET
jgi:hypothetical protein